MVAAYKLHLALTVPLVKLFHKLDLWMLINCHVLSLNYCRLRWILLGDESMSSFATKIVGLIQ